MKNIIKICFLFVVMGSNAQSSNKNYVQETTRRYPSTSPITILENEHITNTTYYDGLGRPVQVVDQNSSPDSNKNIVTHIEYEKNIGQVKEYLPFTADGGSGGVPFQPSTFHSDFVDNGKNLTRTFYSTLNYENTTNPYSENRKEISPRQRTLEAGFPGLHWDINHSGGSTPEGLRNTIRKSYSLNNPNEVKRYSVTTTFNDGVYKNGITENGFYPRNILTKTVVKNENWKTGDGLNNTVEEFKDSRGNVILKRTYNNGGAHDTYYVYNKLNLLAFVIPPMANGSVLGDHLEKWCYQYNYDAKKRLVEKKIPQKHWEYIVYDKADRVVMTGPVYNPFGDGSKGWLITKYDVFGRGIYTGYYAAGTFTSAARHSLSQNNFTIESKSAGTTTIDGITTRYTNSSFPTSFKLLSVNYYDDYYYPNAPTSFSAVETQTVNTAVKGRLTGTWTRILTTPSSTAGNLSYNLYNDKYDVIRSYVQNHLGGYTQVDSQLKFTGLPGKTVTYQKQNGSAAILTVTDLYIYDHRDRLTKQTQQIGTGTVETIVANTYDGLGVLVTKKVGGATGNLQTVGYGYNIRGWLRQITGNLFYYSLHYGGEFGVYDNDPLYNGNIDLAIWQTATDNQFRGYDYKYDHLNRLTQGKYLRLGSFDGGALYGPDGNYFETVSYDKNGNILTMNRTGELEGGQPIQTDDLTYTYNGSQLQTVTDATNNDDGFKDGNKVGNDYLYDTFGNITQDKNKGITAISYNHLNLPYQVTFANGSNIKYTYDAAGTRLSKKVQPSGGALVTTDYVNGFQYENNVLQFFPHAEGYVKRNTNNTYLYVYQYKDHLGNIRLSYADVNGNGTIQPASEILEENNYYPFGLKHKGYNEIVNSNRSEAAEKYKFLGQERQEELGLDWDVFKYRSYDYSIGRFMNIDPIAEEYNYMTPYQFASNNPVWNVELEGLEGVKFQEVDKNGKFIRHVVKLKVAVLTVKSLDKDFKKTLTAKEIRNRVTSSLEITDVSKIKGVLNKVYNGDGEGRQNSKGETVFFQFDVKELNIGANEKTNEMSLRNIAKKSGIESGEVDHIDQATGKEVFKSSPMNIIQGISAKNPNARGDNDQIITRVPDSDTHYNQAVGHETAHQFLTRSKTTEHEIISDFGLELDAKAMDAILKDAFLDKNPIQINNSQ